VVDRRGRPVEGAVCALDTTVYAAATGASTVSSFTTDSKGLLPGWVEPGRYTFTEPDSDTRTVIAGGGYQTVMDEGSVMAKRDTLRFEGDAIALQDDAGNDRTRVIVTGSPGAAGPPGEIFGVDVWNQDPDPESVTDWGPTINALIDAGNTRLLFRAEEFPFSTQISVLNKRGVVFEGEGALVWPGTSSSLPPSRLVWKGGGSSGTAIVVTAGEGFQFRNLGILYDHASYDGDLVHFAEGFIPGGAGGAEWCTFSYKTGITEFTSDGPARSLVSLNGTNQMRFAFCSFSGAQSLVRGYDFADKKTSTDQVFDTCVFQGSCIQHILNPADSWLFSHSVFEFVGTVTASFRSDHAASAVFYAVNISLDSNWFWDGSGDQCVFDQSANDTWYIESRFNKTLAMPVNMYRLNGPGSLVSIHDKFSGNLTGTDYFIDLGDSATALKEQVFILAPGMFSTSGYTPIKNIAGHRQVNIIGGQKDAKLSEIVTLAGHERLGYVNPTAGGSTPTLAKAAGQPAASGAEVHGNDTAGIIIWSTGGQASVAGDLLELTFNEPMASDGTSAVTADFRVPCVQITPADVDGIGFDYDGDVASTAQPSASVTGGDSAGFTLRCKNAIPNTASKVAFFYRVTMI
jgi:hypothetical protein